MSLDINTHLVSNFVHYAVFRAMTLGLSTTSLTSLCATLLGIEKGEINPNMANAVATPVLCLLARMASIQIQEPITDGRSLGWAIEDIRAGFEVADDDFAPAVQKEAVHSMEHWLAPESIIESRLAEDMLPFGFQVKSTVAHSIGAIKGVRSGVFSPDKSPWPDSFASLHEMVASAITDLAALDPAEINAFEGRDMRFETGNYKLEFTAENFLMSFSQPNFYFHATTAYDILRAKGLAIGKKDFIGRRRTKA